MLKATLGHWTKVNEKDYQNRIAQIRGGAQPLSATEWKKHLKPNSFEAKLRTQNIELSSKFLTQ